MEQKKKKTATFKNKIINVFMKNGNKNISEKILLKSLKLLQKSSKKPFQHLIQLAVINTALTFKLNEQIVKKGKRKSKKIIPLFILKDSSRIMVSLKYIKINAYKSKNSANKNIAKEILSFSFLKNQLVEQKTKLQTRILLNKRYLSKFKW